MRWFGIVYTPLMAVVGLLMIVLSFATSDRDGGQTMLIAGAILGAGACISGAIKHQD